MKIVLIGFSGSYKSAVGKLLSQQKGLSFCDTDAQIERTHGNVSDIFATHGESYFRTLESSVLAENDADVTSTGGGTVLAQGFADFVKGKTVVWLKTSAQVVFSRILHDGSRPLSDGLTLDQLAIAICERNALYEQFATVTVTTDDKTPSDLVAEILALID